MPRFVALVLLGMTLTASAAHARGVVRVSDCVVTIGSFCPLETIGFSAVVIIVLAPIVLSVAWLRSKMWTPAPGEVEPEMVDRQNTVLDRFARVPDEAARRLVSQFGPRAPEIAIAQARRYYDQADTERAQKWRVIAQIAENTLFPERSGGRATS